MSKPHTPKHSRDTPGDSAALHHILVESYRETVRQRLKSFQAGAQNVESKHREEQSKHEEQTSTYED